jgi:sulfate permease, SulP family
VARWLARYQLSWLRWDLLAGLTAAAVVLPQALAYASLAGLPVQVGLYVALVPMLVYALLGTSRPLSVSSTSTISILTAGALAEVGAATDPGRAAATASLLALLVGGILAVAGLLRLGNLADFISTPVLAGFKAGMGLVIAASQLGKVLGVPVEGDDFFAKVWSALQQLGDADPATVTLALGALAVLLALRRWAPMVPGPLVVVVLGIALVSLTDLGQRGVALVGPVSGGLPEFELPDLAGAGALLPAAAGIALMSFIESISAARAFAAKTDPPVDADLEITALERLADLAEDLHGRGMALWVTGLGQRPYEVTRRAAELLGRTSLDTGSGPLGVRFFERLDQAVAAYERRAEPDRPPA